MNSCEERAVDEPRDHLADVVADARIGRDDAVQLVLRVGRRLRVAGIARAQRRRREVGDDRAHERERVLVVVGVVVGDAGDARVHVGAAELFGLTISPVAACTSGGPPRKIVPLPATMTVSSDIAGTYAPPAVHEPITAAICGIPSLDIRAWL